MPEHYDTPRYELFDRPAGSMLAHLDEVQWADWAGGGMGARPRTDAPENGHATRRSQALAGP
jgi:hypothetical protein